MFRFHISAKLVSAFALLLAVMIGMGVFAESKIAEVNGISAELRDRWLPASQTLGDIHAYLSQYRIKQTDEVFEPGPRTEKLVRNAQAVIDGLVVDYGKQAATPEQKAAIAQFQTAWQAYTAANETMLQQVGTDPEAAKASFAGDSLDQFYTLEDDVLQMIDINSKGAAAVSARSQRIYKQAGTFMVAAVGVGLTIAVLLLAALMHNIARPINRMSEAVSRLVGGDYQVDLPGLARKDELGNLARALDRFKDLFAADHERATAEAERARETQTTIDAIGGGLAALAEGNLTHRVPENGRGALAKLHVDYNAAVSELTGVLAKIVEGCTTIKIGTDEIAAATSDLSDRSEQQASSLAETARTLSEFTGMVKITADNARQTSGRLTVARDTAEKVDTIAKQAVGAMRSIESSSREMAEIVNVIDGIAFQTNLLALNAGVEAARAGDAGKGFAVVANEVRALAQRSADAAKDIKSLITASTDHIGGGVSLVESSGEALRQIVSEVSAVSGLVEEIAEAAEKQADGIAEISGMVAAMDSFTQQNAAMVEETSAGTRNLSIETEALVGQLDRFRLGRETAGLSAGRTRAVPPPPSKAPAPRAAFDGNAAVALSEHDWSEF